MSATEKHHTHFRRALIRTTVSAYMFGPNKKALCKFQIVLSETNVPCRNGDQWTLVAICHSAHHKASVYKQPETQLHLYSPPTGLLRCKLGRRHKTREFWSFPSSSLHLLTPQLWSVLSEHADVLKTDETPPAPALKCDEDGTFPKSWTNFLDSTRSVQPVQERWRSIGWCECQHSLASFRQRRLEKTQWNKE